VDPWGAAAGLAAYLAYGAPTILSGRATFDGYIKLDDTATYLAMLDRIETHGHDLSGLAPSTYEATLHTSLAFGYPVGSFAPLLENGSVRAALPLATAAAAVVGVMSLGGALWLALLLPALALVVVLRGAALAVRAVGVFAVAAVVLSLPPIAAAFTWLGHAGAFTSESELGNLVGPLRFVQVAGIWPNGDFRRPPHDLSPTYVLVAIVFVAAAAGVV